MAPAHSWVPTPERAEERGAAWSGQDWTVLAQHPQTLYT